MTKLSLRLQTLAISSTLLVAPLAFAADDNNDGTPDVMEQSQTTNPASSTSTPSGSVSPTQAGQTTQPMSKEQYKQHRKNLKEQRKTLKKQQKEERNNLKRQHKEAMQALKQKHNDQHTALAQNALQPAPQTNQ